MSAAVEAAARALNPLAWIEHDRMDDVAGEPSPELVVERSVAQSTSALSAALPHLIEGIPAVIDNAQREWKAAGRHEPLTAAIARAVTNHLERRITDAG